MYKSVALYCTVCQIEHPTVLLAKPPQLKFDHTFIYSIVAPHWLKHVVVVAPATMTNLDFPKFPPGNIHKAPIWDVRVRGLVKGSVATSFAITTVPVLQAVSNYSDTRDELEALFTNCYSC